MMRPLMPRKGPAPKPKPIHLAEMLDSWMVRNNYTNEDIASALGLSDKNGWRAVTRWRNGGGFPERTLEHELARLMGVAVEDLYPPGTFEDAAASNETRELLERIAQGVQRNLELLTELAAHLLPGVESDVALTLEQPDESEQRAGETERRSQSPRAKRSPNGT